MRTIAIDNVTAKLPLCSHPPIDVSEGKAGAFLHFFVHANQRAMPGYEKRASISGSPLSQAMQVDLAHSALSRRMFLHTSSVHSFGNRYHP